MGFQIHYELAAGIFMLATTLVFYQQKHLRMYRGRFFLTLMAFVVLADFMDVTRVMIADAAAPVPLQAIVNVAYLLCYITYSLFYTVYIMALIHRLDFIRKNRFLWGLPYVICFLAVITTPWTGFVFGYDVHGNYMQGILTQLPYIISILYVISPLPLALRRSSNLTRKERTWVISVPILIMATSLIQRLFLPEVRLIYVINCLVIFCCFIFLQNSDYFMDEVTGFFKMHGFEEVVRERMAYSEPCCILLIRIMNYNAMTEMNEDSKLTHIQSEMAEIMRLRCGQKDFYHIAASTFAVISSNREESEQIYQTLSEDLPKVWTVDGEEIVHEYSYYIVETPKECDSVEELFMRVSYARSDHQSHHQPGELIQLSHESVKLAEDKQMVADLIEQAIMDNSIEIYFQPIYSLEKGRVTSLEVLSRLKDKDKNFINPEFFIHVAEENHDIIALGEQIYRKACIFAVQNHIFEMGIDDININLSPVQCCYEELAQDLIRIAGEYNIPMSRMHLEITESGIMDKEEIRDTLATLRSSGAKIALDDFGTGYSNISSIVSLPVDFVKIDKSLVWSYGRGENKYLDQLVPMIHAEGKRIISEGIETQEHIDIFKRLNGDFLQGYFYSKPLPEQEFIQYLKEANQVTV